MSMSFEFRTYFSIQLLTAARLFCDNSYNIESKYAKEFLTMSKEEKHRLSRDNISFVTGAIISCVTFLEANINEFYGDAYDKQYNGRLEPLSEESIKLIGEIWRSIEKKESTLDKYNKALKLASKEKLNKGMEPYQSVCLLINLRNNLVHYKTETVKSSSFDPKNKHELEKKLSNKFIENTFYKFTGNPYHPHKLLGYGCAKWAFNSVVLLADEFYSKMGVKPYYEHVRDEVINKDLKEIDISGIINHYNGIKNQHKSSNNNGERIVAAPFEIKLELIEIDNKIELF